MCLYLNYDKITQYFLFFIFIDFLYLYGTITLVITSIVGIFKKENDNLDNRSEDGCVNISVFQNYKLLWDILKLPRIRVLAVALLTIRVNINYIILV